MFQHSYLVMMKTSKNSASGSNVTLTGGIEGLPVLRFEGTMCPNYHLFKDEIGTYTLRTYGIIGTLFETGTMPDFPEPTFPVIAAEESKDQTKIRQQHYLKQLELVERERMEIRKTGVRVYGLIWGQMSLESQEKVRQNPRFEEAFAEKDPAKLWSVITTSHMRSTHGFGVFDQLRARDTYNSLRQGPGESLSQFKKRTTEALDLLKSVNETIPSEEAQATDFIHRLDERHQELKDGLLNAVTLGTAKSPGTLVEAYNLAVQYRVPTGQQPSTATNPIFVTTRSSRGAANPASQKSKTVKKCFNCGKAGHFKRDCRLPVKEGAARKETVNLAFAGGEVVMVTGTESTSREGRVLLDNQATISIFRDKSLLTNVRRRDPVNVCGINGACMAVSLEGDTGAFGTVLFDPKASANVLSMSLMSKRGKVEYDQPSEVFTVTIGGETTRFCHIGGLYAADLIPHESTLVIDTVRHREEGIPKRTLEKLKGAIKLVETLGYPSDRDLIRLIEAGKILNCPFTSRELIQARQVYGPSIGALKGKTKRDAPRAVPIFPVPIPLQPDQVLYCDIMFVDSEMFVIAVSKPLGMTSVCQIASRSAKNVFLALRKHISAYSSQRFRVTTLVWDREAAVMGLTPKLNAEGVRVEAMGSGQHVPVVESKIRVVKERARGILNTLPYRLPAQLTGALISYVVSRLNWMPNVNTDGVSSPKSIYLGRLMDIGVDARIAFGEYAQVKTIHEASNSMDPRTVGAIALNPAENLQGSVRFFGIKSRTVFVRDQWTSLPMPTEAIEEMNLIAEGRVTPETKPLEATAETPGLEETQRKKAEPVVKAPEAASRNAAGDRPTHCRTSA